MRTDDVEGDRGERTDLDPLCKSSRRRRRGLCLSVREALAVRSKLPKLARARKRSLVFVSLALFYFTACTLSFVSVACTLQASSRLLETPTRCSVAACSRLSFLPKLANAR